MKKRLLLILLAISFVASLVPFPTTVVTNWSFRLVDQNEKPISHTNVEQSCEHYTYYTNWNICADYPDARQKTDANGHVEFSEKLIWLSMFSRGIRALFHHFLRFFHGSVGISSTLFVHSEMDLEPSVINLDSGPPLDGIIVLSRKD